MTKLFILLASLSLLCCSQKKGGETSTTSQTKQTSTKAPQFNADNAYSHIAKQVAFGPRVPNTEAHKACGDYLVAGLKRSGAQIFEQEAILTAYNGTKLNARNIIGSFDTGNPKRVLLFAHWDSRPFADQDSNAANHYMHIDGANDGGSGVGVLLEIARLIGEKSPGIGVDIIFFDAEDYGEPVFEKSNKENTWCLGSQFWAKNPHVKNYKADYGILLDMVGAKNATFYKESYSVQYASPLVEKIWGKARDLGYGKYFINAKGGYITDDHVPVIQERGIPCVDIIHLDPDTDNGFAGYWHTIHDTMENIDRETLKAVGQIVLEIVYN